MSEHYFPSKTVTARKPYTCWACGGAIREGDRYRHHTVVNFEASHRFNHHREYARCVRQFTGHDLEELHA